MSRTFCADLRSFLKNPLVERSLEVWRLRDTTCAFPSSKGELLTQWISQAPVCKIDLRSTNIARGSHVALSLKVVSLGCH